jgi:hypothetical protein
VWLGPLIGAAVFAFLPEVLNLSPNVSQLVYGLVLIGVIISMPIGVGGAIKGGYTWLRLRINTNSSTIDGERPLDAQMGSTIEATNPNPAV